MLLEKTVHIPDLGDIGADSGFHVLSSTEDGKFTVGKMLNVHLSQFTTKTVTDLLGKIT